MFKRDIHHYHVVEVEKGSKLPEMNGDLRESLKTLQHHPGFQYLIQRWRFHKAALETTLKEGLNLTEVQLRYLQAGIYWAGKIEDEINLLTKATPKSRPAEDDEHAAFAAMASNLELVK